MPDAYSLIRRAILERRQVQAFYEGRFREICPHVLGTKDGRQRTLCFQFGGESEGGLPPGGDWRCLQIDKLTDVSVHDGNWHSGLNYDPVGQTCVEVIDVAIPVGD